MDGMTWQELFVRAAIVIATMAVLWVVSEWRSWK